MVTIGIDPHKRTHTAVAVDEHRQQLGELQVVASPAMTPTLLRWASAWPARRWAIEGSDGLGRLLAQQLVAARETVVDVPPTLAARAAATRRNAALLRQRACSMTRCRFVSPARDLAGSSRHDAGASALAPGLLSTPQRRSPRTETLSIRVTMLVLQRRPAGDLRGPRRRAFGDAPRRSRPRRPVCNRQPPSPSDDSCGTGLPTSSATRKHW